MNRNDLNLGMHRPISRRDFLNGVGVIAAGVFASGCANPRGRAPKPTARDAGSYPPSRGGLRGSHTGSFEVAHQLAFDGRRDWGGVAEPDSAIYDLVVVGGGISGLSAAYFQLERNPRSTILILDNHDDFGGHAKRNEFDLGGRTVLGYGGSQTLENPSYYNVETKKLLKEIGVELSKFDDAYDDGFFRRHGLTGAVYFDRATYGVDRTVPIERVGFSDYLALAPTSKPSRSTAGRMAMRTTTTRCSIRITPMAQRRTRSGAGNWVGSRTRTRVRAPASIARSTRPSGRSANSMGEPSFASRSGRSRSEGVSPDHS